MACDTVPTDELKKKTCTSLFLAGLMKPGAMRSRGTKKVSPCGFLY